MMNLPDEPAVLDKEDLKEPAVSYMTLAELRDTIQQLEDGTVLKISFPDGGT